MLVPAIHQHETAISSVRFSRSVVSNSLWPHGLQHARPLCLSPTPRVYPNSCPLSRNAIQPSHPLLTLLLPPSILSSIRVFSNESVLQIRWTKYWSFSFNISPSKEYSGLISLRINWFDPCSPRNSQESSPNHSSKTSILWCSAFFIVQLSHPFMIHDNWKNYSFN